MSGRRDPAGFSAAAPRIPAQQVIDAGAMTAEVPQGSTAALLELTPRDAERALAPRDPGTGVAQTTCDGDVPRGDGLVAMAS
ncbi:hypothetical protein [Sorangium sp. So ce406]|uniref:hypothetical protein n=1 Tax=Sorangium sp. So ce406 TaxID=3133311 RepID=UPI003F5B3F80